MLPVVCFVVCARATIMFKNYLWDVYNLLFLLDQMFGILFVHIWSCLLWLTT